MRFLRQKAPGRNLVSHSNIKTKRRFNPNLQRVRHQFPDGSVRTLTVCTRCLRSGAVTKPAARKQVSFSLGCRNRPRQSAAGAFFINARIFPLLTPLHARSRWAVRRRPGSLPSFWRNITGLPAWPTIPSGAIGDLCSAPAAYRMC